MSCERVEFDARQLNLVGSLKNGQRRGQLYFAFARVNIINYCYCHTIVIIVTDAIVIILFKIHTDSVCVKSLHNLKQSRCFHVSVYSVIYILFNIEFLDFQLVT